MAAHVEGWWIFIFFQTSDWGWPACGRLGIQTSARTKTSARLKITFVDMTYPKGWTGSLSLCPLIFSCYRLIVTYRPVPIVRLRTSFDFTALFYKHFFAFRATFELFLCILAKFGATFCLFLVAGILLWWWNWIIIHKATKRRVEMRLTQCILVLLSVAFDVKQ